MKKEKNMKMPMPTKSNLSSRTSTINNAFAMSIIPYKEEKDEAKIKAYYEELGVEEGQCAYCMRKGEAKTGDHLHPLTKDKLPSGYLTDINNIIPCCAACNSSKGGKEFAEWYLSDRNVKRLKGKNYQLSDELMHKRYKVIMEYISKHSKEPLDLESIVGKEDWNKFMNMKTNLEKILKEDQTFCDYLNKKICEYVYGQNKGN